jgi:DNA-binding NtrC family response regulator
MAEDQGAPTVLVVDDDDLRALLVGMVRGAGYRVLEAADGEEALDLLRGHRVGCVLTDVRMPGISGLTLLERIRENDRSLRVVLLTAHGALDDAARALGRGAWDYLPKPVEREALGAALGRALVASGATGGTAGTLAGRLAPGRSPAMAALYERLARVAAVDAPVLLQGETGAGKEWAARALRERSARRQGPFVAVHGSTLALGVLESELFGHTRGSYTGAQGAREGLFQRAHGGILLLDEVADLPWAVQAELLRVLERGEVRPLGSDHCVTVDVRVLATTREDLRTRVLEGTFRADLYYRLRVLELTVPPLRACPQEVVPLAEQFLQATATGRRFTPEALAALTTRTWPGNVRELRAVVERAAALARGPWIHPDDLAPEREVPPQARPPATPTDPTTAVRAAVNTCLTPSLPSLGELSRRYAQAVLTACRGSRARAAAILEIDRKTLGRLLGD